jgi:AraC-like DNA-binding protein
MTSSCDTVCLLPDESWRLVTRLTLGHQLPARATFAASLVAMIRTGKFGLVIVDPVGFRDDLYDAAVTAVDEVGAIACVLATLTTISAARTLQSSECVPTELVFRGAGGAGRVIQRLLEAGRGLSASAWLLRVLTARIARLDPPLRTAVVGVFGGLEIPRVVQDFADGAGVGRRAAERAVAAAGLRSVKRLLDVVRVARAWDAMATRRQSLYDVSDDVGFPSVRTLVEHYDSFVGVPPRRSSKQINGRELARRLALRLVNSDAPAAPPSHDAADRPLESPAAARPAGVRRDSAVDDANPRLAT